jgi:hypothetical protein
VRLTATRAATAAVVIAVAAVAATQGDRRAYHDVATAPALRVRSGNGGRVGFDAVPGTVGITAYVTLHPTAPLTLISVTPFHADPGVDVLAARAVISGGTSSRYPKAPVSAPLLLCAPSWPVRGLGPSYPVTGLALDPGLWVDVVFYATARTTGMHTLTGFRIRYRTGDSREHEVTSDEWALVMSLHEPGTPMPDPHSAPCTPTDETAWTRPAPGYPA